MNTTKAERARGVKLRVLDLSTVPALIADKLQPGEEASTAFAPWAMAERADGQLVVVCVEGVGWEVTDDEPLAVGLYVSRPGFTSLQPRWNVLLDPDEVRELATDEEIDLADLVRTFGARLESNFWTWHRQLADDTATYRGNYGHI